MKFIEEKLEKAFTELLRQEGFSRTANALAAHLHFLPKHKPMLKNVKELPMQQDTVKNGQQSNDRKEQRRHNNTHPKVMVSSKCGIK